MYYSNYIGKLTPPQSASSKNQNPAGKIVDANILPSNDLKSFSPEFKILPKEGFHIYFIY
jgi:hypothetical protein